MRLSTATDCEQRNGYSAATIAQLIEAPVTAVRRWARRGYLTPLSNHSCGECFGFEELPVAKTLARMADAGLTASGVDRIVDQLHASADPGERPLADWEFDFQGGEVVVRQGDGCCEASGQLLLPFHAAADDSADPASSECKLLRFREPLPGVGQLRAKAEDWLEQGDAEQAEEAYRSILMSGQGTAEDHFGLAEALYHKGDLSGARERFAVCLEHDEDHLDARLSLGCVYAELGVYDLAVPALLGVLDAAPDCPDALIPLADLYDRLGHQDEADELRRQLLRVAPDGPWSQEAQERLNLRATVAPQLEIPSR